MMESVKQWINSDDLKPRPPLGISGLLMESFKTIKRNMKLMLPLLLVVFLLSSHLDLAKIHFLEPVSKDLASQLAEDPKLMQDFGNKMHQTEYRDALNDIREVLLVELFMLTISSIISLLFLVATVSSCSEAYKSKVQNFTQMIMKIKKSLKKPILTNFYMILLTVGALFVCLFSVGVVSIFATDQSSAYLFCGVVLFSMMILWVYVSAVWMMSLVVSVLENVGGMEAVIRGREVMKGGKVKALVFVVLYYVCYGVVQWMTSSVVRPDMEKWLRVCVSVGLTNALLCALKLFVFVVFTVFYHEQKERCGEKEARILYLPVVGEEV